MELKTLKLKNLRNEEHYKFNLDFENLVTQFTPETLGIQTLYPAYQTASIAEKAALNVVQGSALTDELFDVDSSRDSLFSGLSGTIKSAINHFDHEKKAAANRLKLLLDTYGNLTIKPYDQETAAIIKLVDELEGSYAADVAKLEITGWINELKSQNQIFDNLKNTRYAEHAAKPQQSLKQARLATDKAYRAIVKRLNALIEVNGEEAYADFVMEVNQRIENYNNVLAHRQGRNAKSKAEESSND